MISLALAPLLLLANAGVFMCWERDEARRSVVERLRRTSLSNTAPPGERAFDFRLVLGARSEKTRQGIARLHRTPGA